MTGAGAGECGASHAVLSSTARLVGRGTFSPSSRFVATCSPTPTSTLFPYTTLFRSVRHPSRSSCFSSADGQFSDEWLARTRSRRLWDNWGQILASDLRESDPVRSRHVRLIPGAWNLRLIPSSGTTADVQCLHTHVATPAIPSTVVPATHRLPGQPWPVSVAPPRRNCTHSEPPGHGSNGCRPRARCGAQQAALRGSNTELFSWPRRQ